MKKLQRILCFIGLHKYYSIHKYSSSTEKLGCHNCNKEFGIHHGRKILVEWDQDMEDHYQFILDDEKEWKTKLKTK